MVMDRIQFEAGELPEHCAGAWKDCRDLHLINDVYVFQTTLLGLGQ